MQGQSKSSSEDITLQRIMQLIVIGNRLLLLWIIFVVGLHHVLHPVHHDQVPAQGPPYLHCHQEVARSRLWTKFLFIPTMEERRMRKPPPSPKHLCEYCISYCIDHGS